MNSKQMVRYLALASAAALTFVLVFAGVLGLRYVPSAMRPSSLVSRQALAPGSPLRPTEEIIVITPGPDGVVTLPTVRPGQIYAFPSPTPPPMLTPPPTPTIIPGPTVTPLPLRTLASDAAGYVAYRVIDSVPDRTNPSFRHPERVTIYTARTDAKGLSEAAPTQLADAALPVWEVAYAPDGSRILNSTGNIDPAWSPDGKQLAFVSTRTGASEV